MRVLVVEDEALLAFDIASHLSAAGFEVVGPALRLADAMSLIDRIGCDAAILDVNLGDGTTSEPAAIELRRRHIPFLVLSGYSPDQHPPALQGAVHLSKPAKISILLSSLRKLGS